jgi:hypothetical protein
MGGVATRRLLIIVPVALMLAYCSFAISVAAVERYDYPGIALQLMPHDAVANGVMADALGRGQITPARQAEIINLSKRALESSLLSPVAMRLLGFVAERQGNPTLARARLQAAAAISRRDIATQYWMINNAVARQDLTGALDHFDVVMRVSMAGRVRLFPILSDAVADPGFVSPLVRLFRKSPNWMTDFIVTTVQSGKATQTMAAIAQKLAPNGTSSDRIISAALSLRLMSEGRYAMMKRFLDSPIAVAAGSGGSARAAVLEPLNESAGLPPLSWTFGRTPALGAESTKAGISFFADSGHDGIVASRQLLMEPGRYRFQFRAHTTPSDAIGGIVWTMKCSPSSDTSLMTATISPSAGLQGRDLTIPPSCPAPWIYLSIAPTENGPTVTGQIDIARLMPVKRFED